MTHIIIRNPHMWRSYLDDQFIEFESKSAFQCANFKFVSNSIRSNSLPSPMMVNFVATQTINFKFILRSILIPSYSNSLMVDLGKSICHLTSMRIHFSLIANLMFIQKALCPMYASFGQLPSCIYASNHFQFVEIHSWPKCEKLCNLS